jgi:hypothetical protein
MWHPALGPAGKPSAPPWREEVSGVFPPGGAAAAAARNTGVVAPTLPPSKGHRRSRGHPLNPGREGESLSALSLLRLGTVVGECSGGLQPSATRVFGRGRRGRLKPSSTLPEAALASWQLLRCERYPKGQRCVLLGRVCDEEPCPMTIGQSDFVPLPDLADVWLV